MVVVYRVRKCQIYFCFLPNEERQSVFQYCSSLSIPVKLTKPHVLIKNTKQYFKSRKESTRPPENKVINIGVSNEQEERAYRFLNTLFISLERLGYTIETSRYGGYRGRSIEKGIFICLKEDSIPIFLKEKQNRVDHKPTDEELKNRYSYRPPYDYVKTGLLHFGIDSYHAKRKNWHDTDNKKIERQIGEIIIWIMDAIHVEKVLREKREAEKVRRLEEERIRLQLEERREKELEQLKLLNQYVENWHKANRIRKFVDAVEVKMSEIDEEEEREKLIVWLKWARDKADFLDPLLGKEDVALGKSEKLFNQIFKDEN